MRILKDEIQDDEGDKWTVKCSKKKKKGAKVRFEDSGKNKVPSKISQESTGGAGWTILTREL